MTLLVSVPAHRATPLRWVATIVFERMLGLAIELRDEAGADQISITSGQGKLTMPSLFPDLSSEQAIWGEQIPPLPLDEWQIADAPSGLGKTANPLPILYGSPTLAQRHDGVACGVDILGTIFFFMSRFEEVALSDRDRHDRFPATASLAHRAGFLQRAIVDEYVDALWALLSQIWPGLERRQRQGRIRVSCDVDYPFHPSANDLPALARAVVSDLRNGLQVGQAIGRGRNFLRHRRGDFTLDPNYTFDWYMDVCERGGYQAEFYFIAGHSAGAIDGNYEVTDQPILDLIRAISQRGHTIGMHGSYNTYRDPKQIMVERARLQAACSSLHADTPINDNRQHFLRWAAQETADHLDAAGFDSDATGGFADRPGFRFGTSHPFAMWSWKQRAPLRIEQCPLVVMDASVFSPKYLGLHAQQGTDLILELRRTALERGGDFNILWHNSELVTDAARDVFEAIIG